MSENVAAKRSHRRGRGRGRALFALIAALLGHAAMLTLFHYVGPELVGSSARSATVTPSAGGVSDERPMEISSLVDTLAAPDAPTPEERRREEEAKKEEARKDVNGQIVDIARPALEQRPEDARFLAEHDSKVDREKRGPRGRDQAGAPVPPVQPSPAERAVQAGQRGKQGAPGEKVALLAPERRRAPSDAHDGLSAADDGEARRKLGSSSGDAREHASQAGDPARSATPSGAGGEHGEGSDAGEASGAKRTAPNLAATPEMLQRAIGAGAGSMDYLKDLDDGDATALNAKKFKFAAFFNRVKRAVAQEWNPTAVYVRHDPSGNVYGIKDRVTVLRVHLQPDGKLGGSNVVQSSGIGFLDDEAQDAFRRAQPFANPPKDLIEADGQVHFTFAFIFELSGRTSFKVYKYR